MFDTDGDGFISAFELGQALASMGESRTVEDLQEMIRGADANGDGQVRLGLRLRGLHGLSCELRAFLLPTWHPSHPSALTQLLTRLPNTCTAAWLVGC